MSDRFVKGPPIRSMDELLFNLRRGYHVYVGDKLVAPMEIRHEKLETVAVWHMDRKLFVARCKK